MAKKWRCTVCGYIHEGPEAPEQCPMCKVGKEKFVEVVEKEGDLEFVTEHVIGDCKGASKELWEGLQNHFMGECTEVGTMISGCSCLVVFNEYTLITEPKENFT